MFKYIFDVYSLYLVYTRVRGGGEKLEVRRLIKFGNSSYVVSIPKNWIKKNNLAKGNLLYLNENGNGELIFSPTKKESIKKFKEAMIEADGKPISTIRRNIVSAYINNCGVITINGSLGNKKSDVESLLHNLVALEVIEQNSNKIVVKDYLNLNDVSLKEVIRRIDTTNRLMLNELKESITKNKDCYDNLILMDLGVDKLRFLTIRLIRNSFNNPEVAEKLEVDNIYLLDSWWLVTNLEKIGDACRRVAKQFNKNNFGNTKRKRFLEIYTAVLSNYNDVMKAYYTNDLNLANKAGAERDKLLEETNKLLNGNNVHFGCVIEILKGIESCIRNIARIIVDKNSDDFIREGILKEENIYGSSV